MTRAGLDDWLQRPDVSWALAAAYAAVIFIVSAHSLRDVDISLFPQSDKLYHMIEYGGFGVLLFHAIDRTRPERPIAANVLLTILLGSAYGASDEFHQSFVPLRDASFADFAFDALAVSLASWLFARWRIHRGRESRQV